jgi:hypothetical protein
MTRRCGSRTSRSTVMCTCHRPSPWRVRPQCRGVVSVRAHARRLMAG